MQEDTTFYTATMARVLAGQGRYDEALQIYRHLLSKSPRDADLMAAMETVRARAEAAAPHWPSVSRVIRQWVRLLLKHRALRQLEKIRVSVSAPENHGDRSK